MFYSTTDKYSTNSLPMWATKLTTTGVGDIRPDKNASTLSLLQITTATLCERDDTRAANAVVETEPPNLNSDERKLWRPGPRAPQSAWPPIPSPPTQQFGASSTFSTPPPSGWLQAGATGLAKRLRRRNRPAR